MGLLDAARKDYEVAAELYAAAVGENTYEDRLRNYRRNFIEAAQALKLAQELGEVAPETKPSDVYKQADDIYRQVANDVGYFLSLASSHETRHRGQARRSGADLHQAILDCEDKLTALSREITGQEAAAIRDMAEQVREVREGSFSVAWHELLRTEGLV